MRYSTIMMIAVLVGRFREEIEEIRFRFEVGPDTLRSNDFVDPAPLPFDDAQKCPA